VIRAGPTRGNCWHIIRELPRTCSLTEGAVGAVRKWLPQEDVTKNTPQEGRKRRDAVRLFGTNSLKEGAARMLERIS
jgi:hypothetical protein